MLEFYYFHMTCVRPALAEFDPFAILHGILFAVLMIFIVSLVVVAMMQIC